MAFSLDFSACSLINCTALRVTDESLYWNESTIPIGEIGHSVIITITDVNGIIDTYDVTAAFEAATVQSDLIFDSTDYNGGNFSDGLYTIIYSIYSLPGDTMPVYTKKKQIFIHCKIACCISTMALALKDYINCNNCDTAYILNYYKMDALYRAMQVAISFGDFATANSNLSLLNELCDFKNCNCG